MDNKMSVFWDCHKDLLRETIQKKNGIKHRESALLSITGCIVGPVRHPHSHPSLLFCSWGSHTALPISLLGAVREMAGVSPWRGAQPC